jgi:hypothetical protein
LQLPMKSDVTVWVPATRLREANNKAVVPEH